MATHWTAAQQAFRNEVRAFCVAELSPETRSKVLQGLLLTRQDYTLWMDRLAARGWLAGFWPKEHGGLGWSATETFIFYDECSYYGAPWLLPFGVNYVGPVIFSYGSEAQKAQHLPGILQNSVFWSQGYSEPNAGSDLAAVQTRARRDGDHYVVNGSKIWTTMAHWADWIFCLVRTNSEGRPQQGISFLLIDLKSSGITIHPIRSIDGQHHLNQVFFDDVRVPVENRVGEENKGWTYAKYLLGHERVLAAETGKLRRLSDRLEACGEQAGLGADRAWLDRMARLKTDILALEWMTLRLLETMEAGQSPGVEGSVLKVRGSQLLAEVSEMTLEVLGEAGLAFEPGALEGAESLEQGHMGAIVDALYLKAAPIFGGSNEIQRGIIAKRALGL